VHPIRSATGAVLEGRTQTDKRQHISCHVAFTGRISVSEQEQPKKGEKTIGETAMRVT
jgi:hypothetical protein